MAVSDEKLEFVWWRKYRELELGNITVTGIPLKKADLSGLI